MDKIEKIRQEIERRLRRENEILWNAKKRGTYPSPSCEYNLLTLTSLRDFLDTLSEEPDKDLEEAARMYAIPHYMKIDVNHIEEYPYDTGLEAAFIAGAMWKEDQLMKEAVEADVNTYKSLETGKSWAAFVIEMPTNNLILGDKVTVIIVRSNETSLGLKEQG